MTTTEDAGVLMAEAAEGSDAWRHTSYGFVHDTEHALVAPLAVGEAMEVDVVAGFTEQFDQAGLFLRAAEDHWIKAGLEFADGALQVGAVVTAPMSDWSVAPVADWQGRVVTVRASRGPDAVTLRVGVAGGSGDVGVGGVGVGGDEAGGVEVGGSAADSGGREVAELHLLRVVPFDGAVTVEAGPFLCAPTRAGLTVRFVGWRRGPADASLH